MKQRWNTSEDQRTIAIRRVMAIIANPDSKPRDVTAAMRVLIAAEAQNQLDEHKIVDVSVETRNDHLATVSADLGIERDVIEAIEAGSSASDGGDAQGRGDGADNSGVEQDSTR